MLRSRWLLRLVRLLRPAGLLGLAAAPLALAVASFGQTLRGGQTTLAFDAQVLADRGMALAHVDTSAVPARLGALGFAVSAPDSALRFAPGADFERFVAASLGHEGGFALRVGEVLLSFPGVRLEWAPEPHLLQLVDASGRAWLDVGQPHARLAAGVLTLENADLLVNAELAELLGRPELAGSYVGVLDATLQVESAPGALGADGSDCIPDIGAPVDVELVALDSLTQAAREPGGRVAMAPGAELVNNGPGDVAWNQAILPDSPAGPHPFLALHLYRLADGVLEQIGRADLKHAFFATNSGCTCAGGHVLFAGCGDFYGVNTNLNQYYLAPREEIDALQRSWTSLGSHFDALPVDDVRDHVGAPDHDAFEHRLVVQEPDLQTPGARYFMEAWYLAPLDTNLLNSLGHREVAPTFGGSAWAFPNVGVMQAGPALDAWVDPASPAPGERSELVDTGQGRVRLAVVTTPLGGGLHRYEWALLNFDYEKQVRSFSVPVLPSMTVSGAGFGDGDADAGNDWTVAVSPIRVTWSAPPGSGLDWGRLANFRMDVDAAPVSSAASLRPLEPGAVFSAPTLAPTPPNGVPIPAVPGSLLALALALAGLRALRGWRHFASRP